MDGVYFYRLRFGLKDTNPFLYEPEMKPQLTKELDADVRTEGVRG